MADKDAGIVRLNVPDPGEVSDGYHTFNELYEHRHALFAVLLKEYHWMAFKTRRNDAGVEMEGWFIAGLNTLHGQITYHMPDAWWDKLAKVRVVEKNTHYDGHSSADVIDRLLKLSGYFGDGYY